MKFTSKYCRTHLPVFFLFWVCTSIAATFVVPRSVVAQTAGETVSVGLYESPPFVMFGDDGTPEGLSIDLWNLLAEGLGFESEFITFDTIRALTSAVENGEIDVAVTNLTISEERHQRMDFTQPWFDAGLRIMVTGEGATGFRAVYNGLADAGHIKAYGWLAFVILLATIGFTIFDRRFDKDFHPRWTDGIANSFYTVMQIAVSGRMPSRKNLFGWIGKIGQALWLIVGLGVVAYITSSVTSVMTTLAITETINGPDDLPGKRVGVFEGSIAQEFGEVRGYDIRVFERVDTAAQALVEGQIDALVADAPVLEYYAHLNPGLDLNVVGPIFAPDKYGFALPPGSDLTKALTIGLLALWEDGTVRALDTDYFGHEW
ncbi:transporter substrate-binding domain-containing protein [Tateyamaria pelophila]|uniref:transporter substrate-binding domain-containing protein n=1 Tax=Tateyamaria pelophila TaxID=328415 RepID=UPI001CC1161A|nr:transporter substrate-binding domain-containing protein [Tateyamaria pelophila]